MSQQYSLFAMLTIFSFGTDTALADAVPGPPVTVAAQNFFASGPVTVFPGQVTSLCATRLEEGQGRAPLNVVIAVIDASNSRLLEAREAALQPGTSVCIVTPGPPQTANGGPNGTTPGSQARVIGIVVRNGSIKQRAEGGVIDRIGPGGGCIVASLQLQSLTAANLLGPTSVYIPMSELRTVLQEREE